MWSVYLDSLPTEDDMTGFPYKWAEDELDALQGSALPLLMERELIYEKLYFSVEIFIVNSYCSLIDYIDKKDPILFVR